MAHNPRLGNLAVNAQAKVLSDLLSAGFCEIRSGEPPENPEDVPAEESLLAKCKFAEVAFADPQAGQLIANKAERTQAIRDGVPGWVRCTTKEGAFVFDGSLGERNANAVVNVKQLVEGQFVDLAGFSYVIPKTL